MRVVGWAWWTPVNLSVQSDSRRESLQPLRKGLRMGNASFSLRPGITVKRYMKDCGLYSVSSSDGPIECCEPTLPQWAPADAGRRFWGAVREPKDVLDEAVQRAFPQGVCGHELKLVTDNGSQFT